MTELNPITPARVAVVANPRCSGGADRRLATIVAINEHLGADVTVIEPGLLPRRLPTGRQVAQVTSGRVVPETMVWRPGPVRSLLERVEPDLVIFETVRAFHPHLLGPWRSVLDFVDQLSRSYRQRSRLASGRGAIAARHGYRILARQHQMLETGWPTMVDVALTAGRRCAERLGATWIPNLAVPMGSAAGPPGGAAPSHDLVFFGTLNYPPNVEAMAWLDHYADHFDGLRVLVAGRSPSSEVVELCARRGWTLMVDYPDLAWLAGQARLSIAPLRSTVGIQNKAIDATMAGLPQVVSSAALDGFGPAIPLVGIDDPAEFADEVRRLLADESAAVDQVKRSQNHLLTSHDVASVATAFQAAVGLTGPAGAPGRRAAQPRERESARPGEEEVRPRGGR